ncbi:Crp/Fnr family transcriptional regulator [Candidatus Enterococcus mansonii]|uniref:Cyclic nucleotide-binding domain-containing protein n=1 Tax=Candidatus Enterococcus mansonii TaxID=1834181 RepID=A0A242C7L1_9ENTE|nr:Crp/Fnr family transcriptional regulator [Enterococcus sp. 4G2_DIV0659]OTO05890.1 hypothetical protein A5880_003065 [Enterococcus sp. 4G2_DIV0659]
MNLQDAWQKYHTDNVFNFSDISDYISDKGRTIIYKSGQSIVEKGDFPLYIYFIIDGIAIGKRHYEDGNEYNYFQVDKQNGNIGLLEILGKKEQYVATITCLTNVEVFRIESAIVYDILMNHLPLLRKCTFLLADDLYNRSGNDGIYYYYTGIDRIRLFLMNYFEQHYSHYDLPIEMSYEKIANQIGVSVRTVGRSIKVLKETNEVTVQSKKMMMSKRQYEKMKVKLAKEEK